jgi:hypothetical protein
VLFVLLFECLHTTFPQNVIKRSATTLLKQNIG